MKIPTMLLKRVLLDVGLQLSDTIDMDSRVIESRYQREGMSFLTITLPTLDDALLQGLTKGRITRDMYTGFRSVSKRRNLPALLSGFFMRIFDDDGFVKAEPDVCAIQAIRQVTRLFKKVELPCSERRIKAAYERYQSNDEEVDWRRRNSHFDSRLFRTVSGILWSGLEMFTGELYCFPGIFGPGATAERLNRNERYTIREWPERAEGSFPSSFHASPREDSIADSGLRYLSVEEERPVRVVQVPKTLKTPRTISVEPSYMMLMQQSIAKPLMVYLESESFGFQSIRFVDQSINRRLARDGSVDGSLATIDLKDASDLVDLNLVREIFRGPCPTFLRMIEDCRSTTARMPDKTLIPLRKFASMGSALCFPIESMVFFTIIMYALVKYSGRVPSRRLLRALARDVAVYGDDIIVPSLMAPVVMETLEAFGLKVNHDKSFHTGLFRESCGGDYYNGVDVTPAYVRQWDDTGTLSRQSHLVAYAALSNTFYMKGLWHASQSIRDVVESSVCRLGRRRGNRLVIPKARNPIGVVHFASFIFDTNVKYSTKQSGYRVEGLRIRATKQPDCPTDMAGFLGLSFQSRYFQERIRQLKTTVSLPPSHGCPPDYRDGSSSPCVQHGLRDQNPICKPDGGCGKEVSPRESVLNRPFGACAPYGGGVQGTEHRVESGILRTGISTRSIPGNESYQVLAADPIHTSWMRDPLDHLRVNSGTTLYTSDRPHALSLKRGWTASHAGLHW